VLQNETAARLVPDGTQGVLYLPGWLTSPPAGYLITERRQPLACPVDEQPTGGNMLGLDSSILLKITRPQAFRVEVYVRHRELPQPSTKV